MCHEEDTRGWPLSSKIDALVSGADCNWVNPVTRESPLLEACRQGHSQVVSLLLSRNAKLGPMPGTGVTPLHCACAHGHEEVALLLLSFGCDANIEDCSGLSCYEMADKNGHQDLAARLKRMQAQLCDHSNRCVCKVATESHRVAGQE